jgi:biotin synthase
VRSIPRTCPPEEEAFSTKGEAMRQLDELKRRVMNREGLGSADASALHALCRTHLYAVLAASSEIREHFKGKRVSLCAIINAKSGLCAENCRFCAQSAHYATDAPTYPLVGPEEIVKAAFQAKAEGAHFFGIVTSGTSIADEDEWAGIYRAVGEMAARGMRPCASLGMLDFTRAEALREAGLFRYHHNLETARSFFDSICSTHDYGEDVETVLSAKRAGLSVCSGGIIGLGETMGHRIELALTLRELDVDSVPINILNPISGTPLANAPPLDPLEILATIAIFRFLLPDKDLKLCGGKERNLRQLLPLGIVAGCNSLMTGDYLTTTGRNTELDLEMIRDLGLEAAFDDSI